MTSTQAPEFRVYGRTPFDELQQATTFAIWHAVDRELGCADLGADACTHDSCRGGNALSHDIEQWREERRDPELRLRRQLVGLRFAAQLGVNLVGWIGNARAEGAAQEQIDFEILAGREARSPSFAAATDY